MRHKFSILLTALALLVVLGASAVWGYRYYREQQALAMLKAALSEPLTKPSWRRFLPATASDVREWVRADGFLPDFSYLLKARVTDGEFQQFVTELGLTPRTPDPNDPEESHWLHWSKPAGFEDTWWDPSSDPATVYSLHHGDMSKLAKYENGFLYFLANNH